MAWKLPEHLAFLFLSTIMILNAKNSMHKLILEICIKNCLCCQYKLNYQIASKEKGDNFNFYHQNAGDVPISRLWKWKNKNEMLKIVKPSWRSFRSEFINFSMKRTRNIIKVIKAFHHETNRIWMKNASHIAGRTGIDSVSHINHGHFSLNVWFHTTIAR